MLRKKAMTSIEMCEDCQKRPVEVEICYSNCDYEALCKRCYVYALKDTVSRYQDRSTEDLIKMMRTMSLVRVVRPNKLMSQ